MKRPVLPIRILLFIRQRISLKSGKQSSKKTQMRTLHLIGEDGTYTNLAFLLSEQCTHMVKLAVFEWSKKSVLRDRRELSGSLPEQLEENLTILTVITAPVQNSPDWTVQICGIILQRQSVRHY